MLFACQEATLAPFCHSAPHKNIRAYQNFQEQSLNRSCLLIHVQHAPTHWFLSLGLGFQKYDPWEVDDLPVIPSAFRKGRWTSSPYSRCTSTQLPWALPSTCLHSSKTWTWLTSLGWWDHSQESYGCRPGRKQMSTVDTTHWYFIPIYYLSNTHSRSLRVLWLWTLY